MKKHRYSEVFEVSQLSYGKNVSKGSTATDHCKNMGQKVSQCHTQYLRTKALQYVQEN